SLCCHKLQATYPGTLNEPFVAFLFSVLLQAGFTEPQQSPAVLVVSYTTLSPLPRLLRRFAFCGTIPRVTPGGRYPPPCSAESGLSSVQRPALQRDRPADSSAINQSTAASKLRRRSPAPPEYVRTAPCGTGLPSPPSIGHPTFASDGCPGSTSARS